MKLDRCLSVLPLFLTVGQVQFLPAVGFSVSIPPPLKKCSFSSIPRKSCPRSNTALRDNDGPEGAASEVLPSSELLQSTFSVVANGGDCDDSYYQEGGGEDEGEDDMDYFRFSSIGELYSPSHPERDVLLDLKTSTVAIVGLGGVGSWAAEALCRSGVGNFVLIDLEDICVSQTTSGLNSVKSNVGKFKTETMRQRLLDIHPSVHVDIIHDFVMNENVREMVAEQLVSKKVDLAIDCIDGAMEKINFWKACQDHGIASITMGSASGKMDPTKVVCRALGEASKSAGESLVACCEQLAEMADDDDDDYESLKKIPCIYSEEVPSKASYGETATGTVCFVSGSFGFVAASKAITTLLDRYEQKNHKDAM